MRAVPAGMRSHPQSRRLRRRWACLGAVALLAATGAPGCGRRTREAVPPPAPQQTERAAAPGGWTLISPAFGPGERIPDAYTCDGEDASPELAWSAPPKGTVELALVCDDPDAPGGVWVHWVLYGLPADRRGLPRGVARSETLADLGGARQGRNSWGEVGYQGPCPPSGPAHHYHFRLYALSAKLDLAPGAERPELDQAMEGRVLAQAELVGVYSR